MSTTTQRLLGALFVGALGVLGLLHLQETRAALDDKVAEAVVTLEKSLSEASGRDEAAVAMGDGLTTLAMAVSDTDERRTMLMFFLILGLLSATVAQWIRLKNLEALSRES